MRSNGIATVLLMVPVLTVPALAIFGIPQFAPVVASPLDEGEDYDRETRGGKSARQSSRDDFFEDVEGFNSDSDDEPSPKKRKSGVSGSHRRDSTRRSKETESSGWTDDSSTLTESKPKRRYSAANVDELADQDAMPASKASKRSFPSEKAFRDKQRPSANARVDDEIRLASAADVDRGIIQAGFDDDNQFDKLQSSASDVRSRATDPRRTKRRESSVEPLSWAAAVERLNQMDVRNFRLEPGRQLGQFIFICSYTPPDNPGLTHRFEAEAEQPLKAVEDVLNQIVEWQQRR